jgi:transcriptional regulator with XRE-family HTH domain
MEAGTVLREARRRAGLSLRRLAERAATSHPTLAAYESGAKIPRVDTLARIVGAAGFTIDLELEPAVGDGDPGARGRELVAALELAEEFPARREAVLRFPPFRRSR